MRDLMNRLHFKQAFFTAATDNTASSGSLDLQGYDSVVLLINTGTLADADATFAVTFKESATGAFSGEENDVAAAELLGTLALASFTFADDNKCFKIGYRGGKRYVKAIVTPSANGSAANLCATWVLGAPHDAPTPNPPQ
jgi:hypothetical protein